MPTPKPKAKKKVNKKSYSTMNAKNIFITLITIVVVAIGVLWTSLFKDYPVDAPKQRLVISNGDTYSGFIDTLAENGKVNFPIVLKIYQKLMIHDTLKAGVYEVRQGMSVRQVLDMIANIDNADMNRVQVIEGTTFKDLIKSLRKNPLVKKEVSHLSYAEILKALDIPFDHPEGLFAPDTYFYDKGESDKTILLDLYKRQMRALDAAWENRDADLPYKDKYEVLTIASIIEKETNVDRELSQVSGVFERRLKLGMRLQTDPTVIYGMGDRYQGKITREDLRTKTAYNTYRIDGLPPTPISLPSKKAIEAAVHPDKSDNIYFVATGNGGHKFTSNLDDHNRAVQEYLSVIRSKKD
jgi:UPF0755 protein